MRPYYTSSTDVPTPILLSILSSSLFRSLSPKNALAFTLLKAVFCRNVFRSPSLAALLWIVLVCIWTHRRDASSHGIAGLIRHRLRDRIRLDWYECRLHRQPDFEYFSSQWMTPGVRFPLVSINQNHTSITFRVDSLCPLIALFRYCILSLTECIVGIMLTH